MANYLQADAETTADRLMFMYTFYMETYEQLKPYFQDMGMEEAYEEQQDDLLLLECFRESYRSSLREDPSVA